MLIAIEGIDGSGKRTQTELLMNRARENGFSAKLFSFPQYGKTNFASLVADYLNGKLGTVMEVPPQISSVLYAGDRFESKAELENALQAYDLVICDRYVPSNLAHQAAKLPPVEREAFCEWLKNIEYGVFGLPKPDLILFLHVPAEISAEMVAKKPRRDYTEHSHDIHEQDSLYLATCSQVFSEIIANDPIGKVIECFCDGRLKPPSEIADAIWSQIQLHCAACKSLRP